MEMPEPDDLFAERYRIESILGQGGFATVYLAMDEAASRHVALKVLRPEKNGEYLAELESRFAREVEIIARLTNVHTVTLFDFGRHDGLLYMVCEYVPGRDLSQVLVAEKVLHPMAVIHILEQVLESLSEAHLHGLLHRDIKPENIRIYEYNEDPYCAKLLDFGIARPAEQAKEAALTADGELLGTPRYMAPEQLMDEEEMSPATDIYSLGLVALEMLIGSSALLGNRWSDQFDRLMTGHVFPIGNYEKIGPSLRALIQKMTARDSAERYQSADAVLRALAMVTKHDSEPSEDRPLPTPSSAPTLEEARPPAPAARGPAPAVMAPPQQESSNQALKIAALILVCVVILVGIAVIDMLGDETAPVVTSQPGVALVKQDAGDQSEPAAAERADADEADIGTADAADMNGLVRGCGSPPRFTGRGEVIKMDGLVQRDALVHIPSEYDPTTPYPLIVLLHRDLQNAHQILDQTEFGAAADKHGFIVLAPDDSKSAPWSWREPKANVALVESEVDLVLDSLCVDPKRIFVVSHGAGGNALEALSCRPWVAAVATNGFRARERKFICETPVASLHIAPLKSRRLPVDGGANCTMVRDLLPLDLHNEKWIERNACSGARSVRSSQDDARCLEYSGCAAPYETCELDAGFGWPGALGAEFGPPEPGQCNDIVPRFGATEAIWEFFSRVSG